MEMSLHVKDRWAIVKLITVPFVINLKISFILLNILIYFIFDVTFKIT